MSVFKNINDNIPNSPKGGSEILLDGLKKHTSFLDYDNINLLLSTPSLDKIKYTKKNLLWQHLSYNDETLQPLIKDKRFTKAINSFVYVSNWQYEKYRYLFQVPTENSYVIKNAIEPIEFIKKPKEKIKLIYTSTPFRGLDVLLSVFELLNRDDIELDIYSSTKIYGKDYEKYHAGTWDHLFEKAKSMKNVNYIGYASNDDVKKALQSAHIFAYPSTFEETCCLAAIEAGAAGCKIVTTNIGALYETCSEYATMVSIQSDINMLIQNYAKILNEEIDNYWSLSNQNNLKEQSDFYNKYYDWNRRAKEWNLLFERMSLD